MVRSSRPASSETLSPAGLFSHPRFRRPVRMESYRRPPGDEEATALTIRHMVRLIAADSTSEIVRRAATEAAHGAGNSERELAAAVFHWIKRHVRFVTDEEIGRPMAAGPEAEILIRPVDLLTMPDPAGDCDDFTMLTAAMLRSLGMDSELVTMAADRGQPDIYSHVYAVAVLSDGSHVPMDTSHGAAPGWTAPAHGKQKVWSTRMEKGLGYALPQWGVDLITAGGKAGVDIARARYAVPPIGTYEQRPDGSVYYRQPQNAGPLNFPGVQFGGSGGTLVLLLIAAVVVIFAIRK